MKYTLLLFNKTYVLSNNLGYYNFMMNSDNFMSNNKITDKSPDLGIPPFYKSAGGNILSGSCIIGIQTMYLLGKDGIRGTFFNALNNPINELQQTVSSSQSMDYITTNYRITCLKECSPGLIYNTTSNDC